MSSVSRQFGSSSTVKRNAMPDWELIWENDNPSASFAAQTLSLNLAKYGWVKVEVHWSTSTIRSQIFDIPVDEDPNTAIFQLTNAQLPTEPAGGMYSLSRLCQVLPDSVFFQDCSRRRLNTTSDSANSTQNGYLVPTRIWGKTTASSAGGDASFRDSGAGMRLLWTNPDPSAEFDAQTINLDLSDYDAIYSGLCNSSANVTSSGIILVDDVAHYFEYVNNTGVNIRFYRRSLRANNSGVVVSNCVRGLQGTSGTANENGAQIPKYIFGIKFG